MEFTLFTDSGISILVENEMAKQSDFAEIYLEKMLFFKMPAVRGINTRLIN